MVIGLGTDVAEVHRIRRSIEQFGDRFLQRVYTEGEQAYARVKGNSAERFAARFAAKEAGMKALGTGWNAGVHWRDLEVLNEASGRPVLHLHGTAKKLAEHLGVRSISLSMTHTAEIAFAVVILEG